MNHAFGVMVSWYPIVSLVPWVWQWESVLCVHVDSLVLCRSSPTRTDPAIWNARLLQTNRRINHDIFQKALLGMEFVSTPLPLLAMLW
jgi:hypothetical protein